MEHDSVQLTHNGEGIYDTYVDQVLPQDSFYEFSFCRDQEVIPRVGDRYQVEIPQLMTESEYLLYLKDPFEGGCVDFVPSDFLVGLPIPITQINTEVKSVKQRGKKFLGDPTGKLKKNRHSEVHSSKATGVTLKVEDPNHSADSGDSNNLTLEQEMKRQMNPKYGGEGCCLVPGSFGSSWSDIEEASFLLGLYIFGKNLVQVRRFIETKTMGDILSHYYGKFYKSDEYLRWSEGRKLRSKRCAYGPRIFTGSRQQELLSRCLHMSEACQNTLLEVSKKFGEEKVSLEEYVLTLKSIVGMKNLVKAVGIGKGKQDLTGIAPETSKYNRVNPMHQEAPSGKAWSSLSPSEIAKFLTGDIRLSKARSSDFFWEAIWPRLLARGWHSEQPRDTKAGYIDSLVFLLPGVKKFSRKRLEKGKHYFDCVADVMKKVVSDPSLVELDTEADARNGNSETAERNPETNLERPSYLKARTPNRDSDLVKLTVVDTSLKNGKLFKVRELKTSPFIVSKKTTSRSHCEEHSSTMFFAQKDINGADLKNMSSAIGDLPTEKYLEMGKSDQGVPVETSYSLNKCIKTSKACKSSSDNKPRKHLKCGQRVKESSLSFLVPLRKRHRKLLPATQSEFRECLLSSSVSLSKEQEKVSSTISSSGSANEAHDGSLWPNEKTQSPVTIDLNLPEVSPHLENVEGSAVELRNAGDDQPSNVAENSSAPVPSADSAGNFRRQGTRNRPPTVRALEALANGRDDQPSNITENSSAPVPTADLTGNFRRQGTRNRPPTARALEALANGFLTTSRKRKHKESFSRKNTMATPEVYDDEQNMLDEMVVNGSFGSGTVAS